MARVKSLSKPSRRGFRSFPSVRLGRPHELISSEEARYAVGGRRLLIASRNFPYVDEPPGAIPAKPGTYQPPRMHKSRLATAQST